MFSGIVEFMSRALEVRPGPAGKRLVIDRYGWKPHEGRLIGEGDSICVSGVCLTVVHAEDRTMAFDCVEETLAKTTLSSLSMGDLVNLEASLTATTPVGGHFMQGHVEGVGIINRVRTGQDHRITIKPPAPLMRYIISKGSIALDGVSMTVAAVEPEHFEVAMIPTTLQKTTLGLVEPGRTVNIETDIISRTVVQTVERMAGGAAEPVTLEMLRSAGFVHGDG